MIENHWLFYYYMIKRLKHLEKIDNQLNLKLIEIINTYQSRYNKSIF